MGTTVVDDMSHTTMSTTMNPRLPWVPSTTTIGTSYGTTIGSTYSSQSMEPTIHTDSMEAACIVAVEILEAPEVDSLPASDTSKQKLIALCE